MNRRVDRWPSDFPIWMLYPLAFVLFFLPLLDIAIGLVPPQFGEIRWRVGAVGLVNGAMMFPLVALLLALVAAHLLDHRKTKRVLAVICGLIGLAFLIATVLFTLDLVQLRRDIPPNRHGAYDIAAIKGEVSQGLVVLVLFVMCVATLRRDKRGSAASAQAGPPPIITATNK